MSTVKISQLAEITKLDANTANSLFMGVDIPSGVTGKFTAHVLAQGLYSNEILNVGNNTVVLPNVTGQFAGRSDAYVQINHQNLNGNGSADIVITADTGTDTTNFLDLGINGSSYNYPDYTVATPLDGYVMMQGNGSQPGGNLVIGTYTTNRDLIISLGTSLNDGHVARFKANGFQLLKKPLFFADGSSQNTAASSVVYTQAAYTKANTVNTYAYSANTFLQANDATTLAVAITTGQANVGNALAAAKVYADTANTWLQANDSTTLEASKFYSDTKLGNAVANVNLYIDSAYARANAGNNFAHSAYAQANTTTTQLTITNSVAQGGFNLAVAANNKMQSAYNKANTAITNYNDSAVSGVINTGVMSEFGFHLNFEDGFGLTGYVDVDQSGNIVTLGHVTADEIKGNSAIRIGSGASIEYLPSASPATCMITSDVGILVDTISTSFSGIVNPQKGFIYTPTILVGNTTSYTVNITNTSFVKATVNADCTFTLSDYQPGKQVEMWITNLSNSNKTITHGCIALNSTTNSPTFTLPATSSAHIKWMSFDGDNANTFVKVSHA